jgi:hypothetical protein
MRANIFGLRVFALDLDPTETCLLYSELGLDSHAVIAGCTPGVIIC